jgi:uncharacterized membrane protein
MNSLTRSLRTYWLAALFMAVNLLLVGALHGRLPDPMPLPWSADGSVVYEIGKPMGALLLPLVHLVILLFLIAAPVMDPGALRASEARRFYPPLVATISGFMVFTTAVVFAASLGYPLRLPQAMLAGLGVLIALVGNYLGKIPKNYVVGIRTPWTLASAYVWERTHRFAAPLFVTGGVALLLHSLVQGDSFNPYFVSTTIVVTVLAPYCYSFLLWRRAGAEA